MNEGSVQRLVRRIAADIEAAPSLDGGADGEGNGPDADGAITRVAGLLAQGHTDVALSHMTEPVIRLASPPAAAGRAANASAGDAEAEFNRAHQAGDPSLARRALAELSAGRCEK